MKTELNVIINKIEYNATVTYSRYNLGNDTDIVLESVCVSNSDMLELLEDEELDYIEGKCEKHYTGECNNYLDEVWERLSKSKYGTVEDLD